MYRCRVLLLLAFLFLPGCFPIELDVSKDGKILIARQEGFFTLDPANGKVQKICGAENGKPVFARFAPDGKSILTVSELKDGFNEFGFAVVPLTGGKGKPVFKGKNTSYVRYSPDGSSLAVVVVPEKKKPEEKVLPQLHLVPLDGSPSKVIATDVGIRFRWFADSKRLLIFEITKALEKEQMFLGNISSLDVATGKRVPLTTALINNEAFFDLSPDNKKVVFTALRADKPGAKLSEEKEYTMHVFDLDVASTTPRKTERSAKFAIYSPDGKHILLGSPPMGFSFDTLTLEITDVNLKAESVAATDAYTKFLSLGGEGMTYPGWVDNNTVFYFIERSVYGTNGKALSLATVGIDGKGKKLQQPYIDLEAFK
jgi:hypothetical protein